MNRRTNRDYFVGIDSTVRLLAKQLLHQSLNARHTGLPADQDDFINLARVHSRVLHTLLAWTNRTLDEVFNHRLQLGPGHLLDQMLGTIGIGGDKRQVDLGLHGGGEFDLGALGRVTQTLQRHFIAFAAKVEAFVLFELVD